MEENKKYVVYGMMAKCSEGTMENYISTDKGHGIIFQGQPVLNANDHLKGINLTHFGDCNSREFYEQAKKEADEKLQAGEEDSFFMKAAKKRAQRSVKAVAFIKEHLMFNKCELDTPLPWIFTSEDHMIDGAPALTLESQCPCRYGGIITIVLQAEEVTEAEELTEENVVVESIPVLAPVEKILVKTKSDFHEMKKRDDVMLPDMSEEDYRDFLEKLEKRGKMRCINRYVKEEFLKKINPAWNAELLQEKYEGEFFENLQENMYKAGITDKRSILMFLSTIGTECEYGTGLTEKYNEGYFDDKNYTINTRGAGLIHVTGETQKSFMQYLYDTLPEGEEKDTVKNYLDGYVTIYNKKGEEQTDNTYKTTVSYIKEDGTVEKKELCASEFIADNYSVESGVWFWGITEKNVALFEWDEENQNYLQKDMTINDYIKHFEDANQNNVFLALQYAVNGKKGLAKGHLKNICETPADIWTEGEERIVIGDKNPTLPNGWDSRNADWGNAQKVEKGLTDEDKE